jgi:hypothetical protein
VNTVFGSEQSDAITSKYPDHLHHYELFKIHSASFGWLLGWLVGRLVS